MEENKTCKRSRKYWEGTTIFNKMAVEGSEKEVIYEHRSKKFKEVRSKLGSKSAKRCSERKATSTAQALGRRYCASPVPGTA